MKDETRVGRREFLHVTSALGGGLLLSISLPACARPSDTLAPTVGPVPTLEGPDSFQPAAYVRLGTDGTITITVHRSEMGQGVRTALPMILAEELDADWSKIRVEQADADTDQVYGDQLTGGSTSIQTSYFRFRMAGAVARDLLLSAAAQVWGVDKTRCRTESGRVIRKDTSESLPYEYLVPLAATLPVPPSAQIDLKKAADFRIIGTRKPRVDGQAIVSGKAEYGLDTRVPGMLYAVVARSPAIDGRLADFDDSKARSLPGVRQIIPLDNAVAVVAEGTWAALEGRRALDLTWAAGPAAGFSSQAEEEKLAAVLKVEPRPQELVAYYVVPFYSHSPMEPMNCLVDARPDRCELWVSTQNPQALKRAVMGLTGLPSDKVDLHVPLIGGGFGRRLEDNSPVAFVFEAVTISQTLGAPVKLMWTREDDIQHDYYHPLSVTRVRAPLDTVTRPTMTRQETRAVPTGPWRAVTNVPEAFARESFLDEYALALGQDPLDLRRSIHKVGRPRAVLDVVAEKSGWGTPLPAGRGRGLAYHSTWGATPVAQVAEVTVDPDGRVRVDRVVCAIACGTVINPDIVEAQVEGGIVFGLTATLKEAIRMEDGTVQQDNFDNYPLLRLDETPTIEVHLVASEDPPSGVGEMVNPVIAPAVANAVFAATGRRVRRLPIRPEDILSS